MKWKSLQPATIVMGIGCLLLAGFFVCLLPAIGIIQQEYAPRCAAKGGDFSKDTLIGTWMARIPTHSDTLKIKGDGTYKQIIHIEYAGFPDMNYESDWQPWYLEYSTNNIPYLHLRGYAFCGMNDSIPCDRRDGDGHDFCQNKYVQMNGEGILIVLGGSTKRPSADGPRYYYFLVYPLGSENTYGYDWQGP
jgi:hypothetical protein